MALLDETYRMTRCSASLRAR